MIEELLKAVLMAGLPIAIISYYLIILTADKTGIHGKNKKQQKLIKTKINKKELKRNDGESHVKHYIYKKWMKFGGGFYGVMTFITYIHIEVYQLIEFAQNFKGFQDFINKIGISMIIGFFIEALMNMITAFIWFIYWFNYLPIGSFWVWIIVSILAHTVATNYAIKINSRSITKA